MKLNKVFITKYFFYLKNIGLFMLTLLVYLIVINNPIYASDDTSFGVDPLKIEIDLISEETQEQKIKIYNLDNEEREYIIYYNEFNIIGEEGKLKIKKITNNDFKISFSEDSVTIPANSSKTITAKFYGKSSLTPREMTYVIFVEPINEAQTTIGSGSFVNGKIGILTYINFTHSGGILGENVKSGQIVEFSTKNKWNFFSPINFTARINNTGNAHYDANSKIIIKNKRGDIINSIDLDNATVLPGTIRILKSNNNDLNFEFNHLLGIFEAELQIQSIDGTLNLNDSLEFYIIPTKIIIALVLGFICISCIGFCVFKKREQKFKA